MSDMDNIAREWLAARGIIAAFLRELLPAMTQEHLEHNAAAILARLASATPPLLLTAGDEAEKEREECARIADTADEWSEHGWEARHWDIAAKIRTRT